MAAPCTGRETFCLDMELPILLTFHLTAYKVNTDVMDGSNISPRRKGSQEGPL
jgi:hypothetical protein